MTCRKTGHDDQMAKFCEELSEDKKTKKKRLNNIVLTGDREP